MMVVFPTRGKKARNASEGEEGEAVDTQSSRGAFRNRRGRRMTAPTELC